MSRGPHHLPAPQWAPHFLSQSSKTHFSEDWAQLDLPAAWEETSSQRSLNSHPDPLPSACCPRGSRGGSRRAPLRLSCLVELSICSVPCQHLRKPPPSSRLWASRPCSQTPVVAPGLAGGHHVQGQRWLALLCLGVGRILGLELPEWGDGSVHT